MLVKLATPLAAATGVVPANGHPATRDTSPVKPVSVPPLPFFAVTPISNDAPATTLVGDDVIESEHAPEKLVLGSLPVLVKLLTEDVHAPPDPAPQLADTEALITPDVPGAMDTA